MGIECNTQTVPATVRWTTNICHLTGRRLKEEVESGYHHLRNKTEDEMKKFLMIMILLTLAGVTGCKEQNPSLKRVNTEVDAFIETYLATYVNDETQDFYVMRAIAKLNKAGYKVNLATYVNETALKTKYNDLEYDSLATIFKGLTIMDIYNTVPPKAVTALNTYTEAPAWNHTIAYLATKIANTNQDLQTSLLSQMSVIREEDYRDADFAGMALMATATDTIDRNIYYDLIESHLTSEGVESWGAANSCSTAMVVLGLLATKVDPSNFLETNLIDALLTFFDSGAASYKIDEEADLIFATPQAFAALAIYKIYAEKKTFVNLFN